MLNIASKNILKSDIIASGDSQKIKFADEVCFGDLDYCCFSQEEYSMLNEEQKEYFWQNELARVWDLSFVIISINDNFDIEYCFNVLSKS